MTKFNRIYLEDVVENQGDLFEYVAENNIDVIDFAQKYMSCDIRQKIDSGSAWYINKFGVELFEECKVDLKKAVDYQDSVQAKWFGEIYALLQWVIGVPSSVMVNLLKPAKLYNLYNGLHDYDMGLAVKMLINNNDLDLKRYSE